MTDDEGEPTIRHFDLWNNNIAYAAENEPFRTPAVFVEFGTVNWRLAGGGVRDAAVRVTLHVITQRNAPTADESLRTDESLEFFDLLTDVNVCLHRHSKTEGSFTHGAVTCVSSVTDHDFAELRHDLETFECHACDYSRNGW